MHVPAIRLAIGLFFVFTVLLFTITLSSDPTSCGCFGEFQVFANARHEALFGMFRNVAFLAILMYGTKHLRATTDS